MTRIIAGIAGGRRLRTPAGSRTRPTTDRVREAMFSSLDDLTGARVLDLYAGSGALGLEALSRGAEAATFVEKDGAVAAVVRQNLRALSLPGGRVVVAAVETFLSGPSERYDVIFADPPYATAVDAVLAALPRWLDGTLVLERSARDAPPDWPSGLVPQRARVYGETTLWYVHSP